MKRYLVRLHYNSGFSNYYPVQARTAESAANKAREYLKRNYRHSMYVPCIGGVQLVKAGMEAELKNDIVSFRREIADAELALNRAKSTLADLELRLIALQEFEPVDSQDTI